MCQVEHDEQDGRRRHHRDGHRRLAVEDCRQCEHAQDEKREGEADDRAQTAPGGHQDHRADEQQCPHQRRDSAPVIEEGVARAAIGARNRAEPDFVAHPERGLARLRGIRLTCRRRRTRFGARLRPVGRDLEQRVTVGVVTALEPNRVLDAWRVRCNPLDLELLFQRYRAGQRIQARPAYLVHHDAVDGLDRTAVGSPELHGDRVVVVRRPQHDRTGHHRQADDREAADHDPAGNRRQHGGDVGQMVRMAEMRMAPV